MPAVCVPLVVRSHYSLCRGVAGPEALVARAVQHGYPALALTDRDNLYGAIAFRKAAQARSLRPILGAELTEPAGGGPGDGDPGAADSTGTAAPGGPAAPRAVCLVRTMEGYANLCRLITRRMTDPGFRLAPALAGLHGGLHVLTDDEPLARALHASLPAGCLWLLLAHPPRGGPDLRRLVALSREIGRPLVASPDVMYLDEADRPLHRTLSAVRGCELVACVPEAVLAPRGSRFPGPDEIVETFRDFPGALVANRVLREECAAFELTLGKPIFPKTPLPPGETAYAHLFHLCLEGMRRRYGGLHPPAMRRLTFELEIIDRLGFPEYFIIVGDICRFARESGIPTVGRGSGAGSIVAYLLGITNVCPLRYGLCFERFLHDRRRDLPDLDVDLCWRRRDDVIDYAYRTYGSDRVAMISTHNTFQARGAFRDVARAHGVSPATVDRWCRLIPHRTDGSLAEALAARARECGAAIPLDDPRVRAILADADRLIGAPRHLGIHCGGIVIGDRPLDHYVPLEAAAKGIVVTQYEMHAIEAIGLVKIDLLGNRAISVISEAVRLVRATGGPAIDPAAIPDGDPAAGDLLARGDTLGVFQIESPGMRNLLKQLGTRDLNGTIAALSLIRPGPAGAGMKERFVRRARGIEPVEVPDPRLKELLAETHGILLYEEDVMRVGAALAGLALAEGDLLRRAIAEIGSTGEEEEVARPFIARAIRHGTPPPVAEAVWRELRRFGAYAFCKAHAAGYGVLAYQEAWLKAHHPAAFAVAILNNHTAMYEQRVQLEDARRHGVPIRHPCVNRSGREFSLEMEAASAAGDSPGAPDSAAPATRPVPIDTPTRPAIRIGLGRVRLLADATIDRILAARAADGPFSGLADFLARVRPMEREAENLILAGAFDFTGIIRPALLCELKMGRRTVVSAAGRLFDPADIPFQAPALSDFDDAERQRWEFEILEVSPGGHPMKHFDVSGLLPSRDLDRARGRIVRMGGIVAATRRVRVKKSGEPMLFLTLEDEDGLFECTLFPPVYRRFAAVLRDSGPYVVEGCAEEQYGAVTLEVARLRHGNS